MIYVRSGRGRFGSSEVASAQGDHGRASASTMGWRGSGRTGLRRSGRSRACYGDGDQHSSKGTRRGPRGREARRCRKRSEERRETTVRGRESRGLASHRGACRPRHARRSRISASLDMQEHARVVRGAAAADACVCWPSSPTSPAPRASFVTAASQPRLPPALPLETRRTGRARLYDDTANPSSPRSWGCSRSTELRLHRLGEGKGGGANARCRAEVRSRCSRCGSPSPDCSPSGYESRPTLTPLRRDGFRHGAPCRLPPNCFTYAPRQCPTNHQRSAEDGLAQILFPLF